MIDVLILSKTHMKGGKCCVGGITNKGRYVRLLTLQGENQPENTELAPRQIYRLTFKEHYDSTPPHVEDVLTQEKVFKGNLGPKTRIIDFITERQIPVWEGGPETLFDGSLKWTSNGSGYINKENVPAHSVGFWVSDKRLSKNISTYGKTRYNYRSTNGWHSLPYVGFDEAIEFIPAGTLLRVSLTRWWDQEGTSELRCSLQLSGWYDL